MTAAGANLTAWKQQREEGRTNFAVAVSDKQGVGAQRAVDDGWGDSSGHAPAPAYPHGYQQPAPRGGMGYGGYGDLDDDIPF